MPGAAPCGRPFRIITGKMISDVLCWQAPTRPMNPTISQKLIDRDMAPDPEAARAEWLAEFRSDLEAFLPIEAIQAVTVPGRYELAPMPEVTYTGLCGPLRRPAGCGDPGHRPQGKGPVVVDAGPALEEPRMTPGMWRARWRGCSRPTGCAG